MNTRISHANPRSHVFFVGAALHTNAPVAWKQGTVKIVYLVTWLAILLVDQCLLSFVGAWVSDLRS